VLDMVDRETGGLGRPHARVHDPLGTEQTPRASLLPSPPAGACVDRERDDPLVVVAVAERTRQPSRLPLPGRSRLEAHDIRAAADERVGRRQAEHAAADNRHIQRARHDGW
jgi:hypothetical protein